MFLATETMTVIVMDAMATTPPDVKEGYLLPHHGYLRVGQKSERADRQQDAQLRRADSPERHPEHSQTVRRQVDLDREQEVRDQYAQCNQRAHVAGYRQAAHKKQHAEAVDDVIDVEPVPRALLLPHPRDRSVEAVAKPVDGEPRNRQEQSQAMSSRQVIREADHHH